MATTHDDVVRELLARHGRPFWAEAGIRLRRNTPAPLFQLLVLCLMSSARISAGIAMRGTTALFEHGLRTPATMLDSTWERRTRILNRAGYARYDESTSRYLAATAELLRERWHGDLRGLRASADGDPDVAADLLQAFTGIGPAGAAMFLREVQEVWDEYDGYVDEPAQRAARRLDLPSSGRALRELTSGRSEFVRLVAALVRSGLAHDEDEILAAAGA
jgi:endonuclease III